MAENAILRCPDLTVQARVLQALSEKGFLLLRE